MRKLAFVTKKTIFLFVLLLLLTTLTVVLYFLSLKQRPEFTAQPDIIIDASKFQTSEQQLAYFASADNESLLTSSNEDLDGDGKNDSISLQLPDNNMSERVINDEVPSVLTVNTTVVKDAFPKDFADGFKIIDVDSTDKFHEIAIHSGFPSSDHHYIIYRYENKSLISLGIINGWINELPNGDKIISTLVWAGFWHRAEQYTFDSETKIFIPFDYGFETNNSSFSSYEMNVKATTKQSLTLLVDYDSAEKTFEVAAGTTLFFQREQNEYNLDGSIKESLYEVMGQYGIRGWLPKRNLEDYFSDLHFAD